MSHNCHECFDGFVECTLNGGCTVQNQSERKHAKDILFEAFQRMQAAKESVILIPLTKEQLKAISGFIWQYVGELPMPTKKHDATLLLDAMAVIDDIIGALDAKSDG